HIQLGIITEFVIVSFSVALPAIVMYVVVILLVFTVFTFIFNLNFLLHLILFAFLFDESIFWIVVRLIGTVFALMTFYQVGWDLIKSEVTGQVMFGLLTTLIVWFFVASYLMPLLMNFGVMEFFGSLLRGVIKPLFTLPGRS